MLKAKDIMTKNVISIGPDDTIEEAARLMFLNGLSGVPVLDKEDQLVGILTEGDLVKKEKAVDLPLMFNLLGTLIYLDNPANGDEIEKQLKDITAIKVKELMSRVVVTVAPDAALEDVANTSLNKKVNPIPVVQSGKIVGIVSRADFVRLIAGGDDLKESLPAKS